MKKIFAAALVLLVVPFSSSAWDKLGHDVSAMIAWENMTSKAKKNISKYLEGHDDIVYYASWMDYMGYVTKSGSFEVSGAAQTKAPGRSLPSTPWALPPVKAEPDSFWPSVRGLAAGKVTIVGTALLIS